MTSIIVVWMKKKHEKNVDATTMTDIIRVFNLILLRLRLAVSLMMSTSQRTTLATPYKIKVNNLKSTDLVIRIELTRAILMPRFSTFLRNSTIRILLFLYLVTWLMKQFETIWNNLKQLKQFYFHKTWHMIYYTSYIGIQYINRQE